MKTMLASKFFVTFFLAAMVLASSCEIVLEEDSPIEPSCNDRGTLTLKNTSYQTTHRVMINGVNYGTLDPGETESFDLVVGSYTVQQIGILGGSGCNSFSVNIVECNVQSYSCGG